MKISNVLLVLFAIPFLIATARLTPFSPYSDTTCIHQTCEKTLLFNLISVCESIEKQEDTKESFSKLLYPGPGKQRLFVYAASESAIPVAKPHLQPVDLIQETPTYLRILRITI